MSEKKKRAGGFSKLKGGSYERKVARELSEWMFGDRNILKRHPTSGADKCIWSGDVVPLAQLPDEWNKQFNFFIEAKSGYERFSPDLTSYQKIVEWFLKAYEEAKEHNQYIIYLITQFKHKKPLIFTNKYVGNLINDPLPKAVIPIRENSNVIWVYVYDYNELLNNYKFHDIYNLQEIINV